MRSEDFLVTRNGKYLKESDDMSSVKKEGKKMGKEISYSGNWNTAWSKLQLDYQASENHLKAVDLMAKGLDELRAAGKDDANAQSRGESKVNMAMSFFTMMGKMRRKDEVRSRRTYYARENKVKIMRDGDKNINRNWLTNSYRNC